MAMDPSRGEKEDDMRASRLSLVLLCGLVVAACSQYSSSGPTPLGASGGSLSSVSGQGNGNSPLTAVMQFGQGNVGSPFQPGPHDQSAHAVDNIVPRTVVIAVNGTVTFNLPASIHQINIYKPGTQPEDVDVSFSNRTNLADHAECGSPLPDALTGAPLIIGDNGDNFEAAIPVPCLAPTQKTYTFRAPGRYLVICAFLPHFEVGMYAWVEVKET
jgi:plastocyanin